MSLVLWIVDAGQLKHEACLVGKEAPALPSGIIIEHPETEFATDDI